MGIGSVLVVAGVVVGARVVRCVFDELTESEYGRQAEIERQRKELIETYSRTKEEINEWTQRNKDGVSAEELKRKEDILYRHNASIREKRDELLDFLIKTAEAQLKDRDELLPEIGEIIKQVKSVLKQQNSMLRRNSLQALLRELEETREKTKAYRVYISKYIDQAQKMKNHRNISEIPKSFSFYVPQEMLYPGKLLYWKKEELFRNGYNSVPMVGAQPYYQKYVLADEAFIQEMKDDALIPVMCVEFKGAPHYCYTLSSRKGYFKNVVANTPKMGITATVIGYDKKHNILLNYADCVDLFLSKKNLVNEKRYPPLGAELRVFPINWTHSLYCAVEVSERISDSYLGYSFDELPLVFSDDQWIEFEKRAEKSGVLRSSGDWKIAPLDETHVWNVNKVKLQLDASLCIAANIVELDKNLYFSYDGMLSEEHYLKPDDVFLGIDCTLDVYLDSDLKMISESAYEGMTDLVLRCMTEFKVQYQTKISRNGMQYFNKWAETTDKLITYLQKGKSVNVEVLSVGNEVQRFGERCEYVIFVKDAERLKSFVNEIYEKKEKHSRHVEFFVEPEEGYYCIASIKADGSCLYISGDNNVLAPYIKQRKVITLYLRNYPYAEVQQAMALQRFRVGKLANSLLQSYALDGNNIKTSKEQQSDVELYNKLIGQDISQLNAVQSALAERDVFLIQGPPGTGKTTVIRELILQVLNRAPLSKILVVSQANVAVDNVLKGLIGKIGSNISFVRCGHRDRIDPAIEPYSFEHIYKLYTERIKEKCTSEVDNRLINEWADILFVEEGYNSNVGELILKSQPIIGATCVGLAQKRIGLDRVEYDLVIIDEAGKALPAEILIPYVRGKKVVMIGDHKQLPPTVHPALLDADKIEIEDREMYEDALFGTSFFQRLYETAPDSNKCMLTTQYRMPDAIGTLVSTLFYDGKLINGNGTNRKRPFFFEKNITIIDTPNEVCPENDKKGKSVTNLEEAKYVIQLLQRIRETVSAEQARIAVITPYKGQKRLIWRVLIDSGVKNLIDRVEINTVDAFQGDEAEIVLFCCTRTKKTTSFFKDPRRINVAFSRAKNELIIIGSLEYFNKYDEDSVLPKVAKEVRRRGSIKSMDEALWHTANNSTSIRMDQVCVSTFYTKDTPKEYKIRGVMKYYQENGKLDKPIVVRKEGDQYVLKDKYLRYYVAQQLGLEFIDAIIEK